MGTCRDQGQLHQSWLHADSIVSLLGNNGESLTELMGVSRTQKIMDDNPELSKQWTSLIPQGRMGKPEDLMGAVTFLLSDAR